MIPTVGFEGAVVAIRVSLGDLCLAPRTRAGILRVRVLGGLGEELALGDAVLAQGGRSFAAVGCRGGRREAVVYLTLLLDPRCGERGFVELLAFCADHGDGVLFIC